MGELFLIFFWSGPVGLGLFLVFLGTFIFLLAKANEINNRTRAVMKDLEKGK